MKKTANLLVVPTMPSTKKRIKQINITIEMEFNPKLSKADIARSMKDLSGDAISNFNFTYGQIGLKMSKAKKDAGHKKKAKASKIR